MGVFVQALVLLNSLFFVSLAHVCNQLHKILLCSGAVHQQWTAPLFRQALRLMYKLLPTYGAAVPDVQPFNCVPSGPSGIDRRISEGTVEPSGYSEFTYTEACVSSARL